jgi:hypothetical protein
MERIPLAESMFLTAPFTLVNSFAADSQPGPFTPYDIQTIGEEVFLI